ncbi:MAG TPA: hypothetical protein VGO56_18640 [Pyrinomonadaceae bacterium]|jgi:hypothetical protein|nr:hypothetical protein [Pyrinomonadaceae bacterium]
MKRARWILLFLLLLLIVLGSWLWWTRPTKVDLANYAPADSLLYLEASEPTEVIKAVYGTDAWKALEQAGGPPQSPPSPWLQAFVRWTGIGPINSVILARAQVAVVLTDLRAVEEGDSLNIKSEGVLIIETHTSERRIKAPFEAALKTLAEKTYSNPTPRTVRIDGVEFSEWIAGEGSRQIVGAVLGSLIVIGTSERVVQDCLAVSQGRRSSLKNDPGLNAMRVQLDSGKALTFGYVPTASSGKLFGVGVPLLMGRAPGDSDVQRLISNGASKIFGSLGWTSRSYLTGIEDRYLISLEPAVIARLKPGFASNNSTPQLQRIVPNGAYSVTTYKFANPQAALLSLKTAVSSQVDSLSAIVFSSLLKSALLAYGIDDADTFLKAVDGELLTLRLDETAERSVLIASVHDRVAVRQLIAKQMSQRTSSASTETFEDATGEFAASLSDEYIVIGSPADVRRYSAMKDDPSALTTADNLRRMTLFASRTSSNNVVTYTDDSDRVRSFIAAFLTAKGGSTTTGQLDDSIAKLPYSITETTLVDRGVERTTRSPLGQFSSLLPLLFPQQPRANK